MENLNPDRSPNPEQKHKEGKKERKKTTNLRLGLQRTTKPEVNYEAECQHCTRWRRVSLVCPHKNVHFKRQELFAWNVGQLEQEVIIVSGCSPGDRAPGRRWYLTARWEKGKVVNFPPCPALREPAKVPI